MLYPSINATSSAAADRAEMLKRDLTGTIISLFLVIGLVVATYFLVRRRSEIAQRRSFLKRLFRFQRRRSRDTAQHRYENATEIAPPPYFATVIGDAHGGPATFAPETLTVTDLLPPPAYNEAVRYPAVHETVSRMSSTSSTGSDGADTAYLTENRQPFQ